MNIFQTILKKLQNGLIFKLEEKIVITIYENLEVYRKHLYEIDSSKYETINDVPNWICANCENNIGINILTLNEYKKTNKHENATIEDFLQTLMHEFTHYCYHKLSFPNLLWVEEGLAINLSGQINTKYKVKSVNNPLKGYNDFALGMKYVLDNYDKDYVKKLISNVDFQKEENPRLFKEIENYYAHLGR